MPGEFLRMGVLGKPHGVRGEIFADWQGENVLPRNGVIHLRLPGGDIEPLEILAARPHKDRLLFTLDGITDRDMAEKLNGAEILMPRAELPPLADDEAYVADLPGCLVSLPDGESIGVLDHVEFPPGQEIWAIKNVQGREILFPAQSAFIVSLDMKERKIVIDPPPGLLDIYNA